MPPHSLTNFEIQRCYQNETRFNGVYSRNNLHKKGQDMHNQSGWVQINTNSLDGFVCEWWWCNIFW